MNSYCKTQVIIDAMLPIDSTYLLLFTENASTQANVSSLEVMLSTGHDLLPMAFQTGTSRLFTTY